MSPNSVTPGQREPAQCVSALLDGEGALTIEVEKALETIFRKYAHGDTTELSTLSINLDGLTAFAMETNGQKLPDEQIDEIRTFFNCDERGNLLFSGFLQMYQLQTENDEAETLRDLKAHGFDNFHSGPPASSG